MSKGVLAAFGAYFTWGFFPLYWRLFQGSPHLEVIFHRMVWAGLLVALFLKLIGHQAPESTTRRQLQFVTLNALLMSLNLVVYIYAVNTNQVVESSLGYFLNPIMNFVLGYFLLQERLTLLQKAAVVLSVLGVAFITADVGRLPWIALVLAAGFALYGYFKKTERVSDLHYLKWESFVAAPVILFLFLLVDQPWKGIPHGPLMGSEKYALLFAGGLVTAIPLVLFALAAPVVPLTILGFLQYVSPTLQWSIGVFWFGEAIGRWELAGFLLIWTGLALVSGEQLVKSFSRPRVDRSS